jgi:hypothetical protein
MITNESLNLSKERFEIKRRLTEEELEKVRSAKEREKITAYNLSKGWFCRWGVWGLWVFEYIPENVKPKYGGLIPKYALLLREPPYHLYNDIFKDDSRVKVIEDWELLQSLSPDTQQSFGGLIDVI